jgi:hypothetical protein
VAKNPENLNANFEKRLRANLDVLSEWIDDRTKPTKQRGAQRLDMNDVAIFAYIDRMDRSKSPRITANRDGADRPWIDLGTLAEAVPLLRLKAQAIGDRIWKMHALGLLNVSWKKLTVQGYGVQSKVYAAPSLQYRIIEEKFSDEEEAAARLRFRERKLRARVNAYIEKKKAKR